MNFQPYVDGVVAEPIGKLGNFPKPVMEALVVKLKEYPIELSVISTGNLKKWNDNEYGLKRGQSEIASDACVSNDMKEKRHED